MDDDTFDAASVGITHHCLLRWLERAKGVDLTAARTIAAGRCTSTKHIDKRIVELIEQEHGLSMDPLRAMIRTEIEDSRITVQLMAKHGGVRSYSATTDDGRTFVVTRRNGQGWFVPTMLDKGMEPL